MARSSDRKTLGRGLSALLGDIAEASVAAPAAAGTEAQGGALAKDSLPIELIHPNPDQPRRRFSDDELDELAASIRERGVIQPVVLRPHPDKDKQYQIVAGERRWRAAQRAGLHALPAVVREIDDRTMLEVAIVENVQRQDLNPIEEAEGYQALIARFGYTQEALAKIVGKSRSHLANTLRLAALPDEVRALVVAGSLSAGHARALIGVEGAETLARKIVADGLSVRQVEALVKAQAGGAKRPTKAVKDGAAKDADTRMLEADLSAAIGMTTVLAPKADGSGEVRIRYQDLDDLDRLCELLSQ